MLLKIQSHRKMFLWWATTFIGSIYLQLNFKSQLENKYLCCKYKKGTAVRTQETRNWWLKEHSKTDEQKDLRDRRPSEGCTYMDLCWWTVARGSAGTEGGWECQPACSWPFWCWPWRTPTAGFVGFRDQTGRPAIKGTSNRTGQKKNGFLEGLFA